MIMSKTSLRVSFLGGSTDYPASVDAWGGFVLGTTIDKHIYITCRKMPKIFDYIALLAAERVREEGK